MRTIYKYQLDPRTVVTGGAPRVLFVGADPRGRDVDAPSVWVELDPAGDEELELVVIGTGHHVPEGATHVGSCVSRSQEFVWHVYKKDQ